MFDTLCRYKDFCVILCSGYFKKDENAFYGRQVIDSLDKLHVDKSFICPTAISIKHGICDFDCDFIDVQRKLTETGNNIYILADSSKFEKTALLKMDEAKREYIYVTDSKMPDALIKLYKENEFIIYRSNEVK